MLNFRNSPLMTMVKGVVLYLIVVIQFSIAYTNRLCPRQCYCTIEFTDCKFNHLTTLPAGIDPNVTSLDLSYNGFEEFPGDLAKFRNLKFLNLSHNTISVLSRDSALTYLDNLEVLDLTFNLFRDWRDIKSEAFIASRKLVYLDFSHNSLRSIPDYPLKIKSLEILRLTNCSMRFLYNTIFNNLPKLLELHISDNQISYLNTTFASSNLKFINLSSCNLKHISEDALTNLTSLETLLLSKNRNLKRFSCSSQSLLYLDLSDCNLEAVPNGYLPKVYLANFRGNHFRVIPDRSFDNFFSLKQLILSDNAISRIESNAFENLNQIEIIDLSLNKLATLNHHVFHTNRRLTTMDLSRNYFSKVESFVIDTLETLDLNTCEIQSIDSEALTGMPSLHSLNLSRNQISSLPEQFQGNSIVNLDLSSCRIKTISNKTFSMMHSLRELNLAGNRLTTATPDCFLQVSTLDITDNPWRCDCVTLRSLYQWLMQTGKGVEGLLCQSPEVFAGASWSQVCGELWHPELHQSETLWWYTTGLIITVFIVLFVILAMRRAYMIKEKRLRQEEERRRSEERETLCRMRRIQLEQQEEETRNAPDPRESQRPPSYTEALLMPPLDASHPSLAGSMYSLASKHSLHGGSNPELNRRGRPKRKRRRRKSESDDGPRASSRIQAESDTNMTDNEQPPTRTTLESDF